MREVGGSYLLVLDTRAQGFADVDRLAATFLSLANGLASSGVSFGVLAHDGQQVAEFSTGDSPRGSLETALRTALSYTHLESSPELLELMPQRGSRGTGDSSGSVFSQLLWLKDERLKDAMQNADPWATALRYINEKSVRSVLWVSGLLAGVEPLMELAWQARHYHDVEFAVADPCFLADATGKEEPRASLQREKLLRTLSSAGVQLQYGEPLAVAQRILSV
jgi:hypothetical protein